MCVCGRVMLAAAGWRMQVSIPRARVMLHNNQRPCLPADLRGSLAAVLAWCLSSCGQQLDFTQLQQLLAALAGSWLGVELRASQHICHGLV